MRRLGLFVAMLFALSLPGLARAGEGCSHGKSEATTASADDRNAPAAHPAGCPGSCPREGSADATGGCACTRSADRDATGAPLEAAPDAERTVATHD